VPATAALLSLWLALGAAWIPLKAVLAQWLLERNWRHVLAGGPPEPPWPWADTTVAAELSVPARGIRLLVLGGNSGRNLAFGPVLLDGNSLDRIVSGHRDTHFRFLQELRPGDLLRLTGPAGSRWYAAADFDVVDSRSHELVLEDGTERLTLVTCYPFDSPTAGGPLRYVVTAYPLPALAGRDGAEGASGLSPRSLSSG
jgi:sortase A